MKTYLCAMFNKNTGHFSPPLLFNTLEIAKDVFIKEIQMENSEIAQIKDALSIYAIGRYEVTSGKVTGYWSKKLILNGCDVKLDIQNNVTSIS